MSRATMVAPLMRSRVASTSDWMSSTNTPLPIDPKFFELEAQARGEKPGEWYQKTPEYNQWQAPVREQDKVVGHAVRAMYMYSGMADVAAEFGDDSLRVALERLWADLVGKRLYVTGGMGPSAYNEGFTEDYDLPNESAYAETCASVGLVFWARRMLEMSLEGRYGDMMEQALYNGALAGISLDGSVFFYENPLESRGNHHRWKWHRCPCCPPNIARLLASIGTYAYAEGQGELAVHLYGESEATLDIGTGKVRIEQRTRYPWEGDVAFTITPDRSCSARPRPKPVRGGKPQHHPPAVATPATLSAPASGSPANRVVALRSSTMPHSISMESASSAAADHTATP